MVAIVLFVPLLQAGEPDSVADSAEMQRIFDEDQKDRNFDLSKVTAENLTKWSAAVQVKDADHRKRTQDLLDKGFLHTGKDFENAAFVFQHGSKANDHLMAHLLAIIAVAKGNSNARWIAAATLDRYLLSIGRPQLFGLQFRNVGEKRGNWTVQEPFDRSLLSDRLRHLFCVPGIAAQERLMSDLNSGRSSQPTIDADQFDSGCKQ